MRINREIAIAPELSCFVIKAAENRKKEEIGNKFCGPRGVECEGGVEGDFNLRFGN